MGWTENFRRMPPGQKALFLIGSVFFLLYFALGMLFLLVKNLPFAMSPALKTGFGILLIVYSVFRMVRLVNNLKNGTE